MVGKISIVEAILEITRLSLISLGHLITHGTLAPPSHIVPLPSLSGPAEPPHFPKFSHGPLSLVNIIKVLSSIS